MGRICGEELCQLTLVSLPFAVVRHPEESNCREGGFIQLTVPGYSPSLRVRQGEKNQTQLLPATVNSNEQQIHTCVLVFSTYMCACVPLDFSIFYKPKCPAQQRVPPTEAGSFCLINIIKIVSHWWSMSTDQPNLGNLALNLSLQLILDCVKSTIKISHQSAARCCMFQGIRTSLEPRKQDDILHSTSHQENWWYYFPLMLHLCINLPLTLRTTWEDRAGLPTAFFHYSLLFPGSIGQSRESDRPPCPSGNKIKQWNDFCRAFLLYYERSRWLHTESTKYKL